MFLSWLVWVRLGWYHPKKQRGYSTIHNSHDVDFFRGLFVFWYKAQYRVCTVSGTKTKLRYPPNVGLPFDRNLLSVTEYVSVFIHDVMLEQSHAGQWEKKDKAYILISSTTTNQNFHRSILLPFPFPVDSHIQWHGRNSFVFRRAIDVVLSRESSTIEWVKHNKQDRRWWVMMV